MAQHNVTVTAVYDTGLYLNAISPSTGTSSRYLIPTVGDTVLVTFSKVGAAANCTMATSGSGLNLTSGTGVFTSNGQTCTYTLQSGTYETSHLFANFSTGTDKYFYWTNVSPVDDLPTLPAFPDPTNQERSTVVESESNIIAGMDASETCTVSISGNSGQIRVNGGSLSSTSKVVENGDTLSVSVTTGAAYSTAYSTTITFTGDTSSDTDTENYQATTRANPGEGLVVDNNFTASYSQRDIMEFFGGDDSLYTIRPDNLRAYFKGGTAGTDHVPDVTANASVGTSSTDISLTQFNNTETRLLFVTLPSTSNDMRSLSLVSGSQDCEVGWDANGEYVLGFSPGMWSICDFRYNVTVNEGSSGNLTYTRTLNTWHAAGATFAIQVTVADNTEEIYTGTVTIEARSQYDNTKIATANANWGMGVIDDEN